MIKENYKNKTVLVTGHAGFKGSWLCAWLSSLGNLGSLGRVRINKPLKLDLLLKAFQNNIGKEGTIFSPAASMNLCNTQIPFDIDLTPSYEMGSFAEYIRTLPDSIRSLHPFWSIAGIGPQAKRLKKFRGMLMELAQPGVIF